MEFARQSVSKVTLLWILSLPSLWASESASLDSQADAQQKSMSKWVQIWLSSPPKTREVSDALVSDLLKKPMNEVASENPTSAATLPPASPRQQAAAVPSGEAVADRPPVVPQENELVLSPPAHEVFSGARPKKPSPR